MPLNLGKEEDLKKRCELIGASTELLKTLVASSLVKAGFNIDKIEQCIIKDIYPHETFKAVQVMLGVEKAKHGGISIIFYVDYDAKTIELNTPKLSEAVWKAFDLCFPDYDKSVMTFLEVRSSRSMKTSPKPRRVLKIKKHNLAVS